MFTVLSTFISYTNITRMCFCCCLYEVTHHVVGKDYKAVYAYDKHVSATYRVVCIVRKVTYIVLNAFLSGDVFNIPKQLVMYRGTLHTPRVLR
jgi:hypothetical protein